MKINCLINYQTAQSKRGKESMDRRILKRQLENRAKACNMWPAAIGKVAHCGCQYLRFVNTTCMYVPKINQSQMKMRRVRQTGRGKNSRKRAKMRRAKQTLIVTYLKRKKKRKRVSMCVSEFEFEFKFKCVSVNKSDTSNWWRWQKVNRSIIKCILIAAISCSVSTLPMPPHTVTLCPHLQVTTAETSSVFCCCSLQQQIPRPLSAKETHMNIREDGCRVTTVSLRHD